MASAPKVLEASASQQAVIAAAEDAYEREAIAHVAAAQKTYRQALQNAGTAFAASAAAAAAAKTATLVGPLATWTAAQAAAEATRVASVASAQETLDDAKTDAYETLQATAGPLITAYGHIGEVYAAMLASVSA